MMTSLNNDELRKIVESFFSAYMLARSPRKVDMIVDELVAYIASHDQQLLEAILEGAEYGVCTGGEWSNEKKQFVCGHDHSGIVPVEHIKSVFKKEGE